MKRLRKTVRKILLMPGVAMILLALAIGAVYATRDWRDSFSEAWANWRDFLYS